MWQDLGLNLLAEAIGIIVTVLGINQLMQWHERRKWARIRERLYRRIALSTDAFLADLVIFGTTRHGIHASDFTRNGKQRSPSYEVRSRFDEYVKPQLLDCPDEKWHYIRNSLQRLLEVLHQISDGYFDLLEPVLLTSILNVEETGSELMDLLSFPAINVAWDAAGKVEKLVKAIDALEKRPEIQTPPDLPGRFQT
jgi:hypothetical protein